MNFSPTNEFLFVETAMLSNKIVLTNGAGSDTTVVLFSILQTILGQPSKNLVNQQMKAKPLKFEELCLPFAISHVWTCLSLRRTHILFRGLIFFFTQVSPFHVGVTTAPPHPSSFSPREPACNQKWFKDSTCHESEIRVLHFHAYKL